MEAKYNEFQINELKTIKYVKNATSKYIIFTIECKLKAIELSNKGFISKEIFKKLGFPDYIINSDLPAKNITKWKSNKKKGSIEFKKGRPKKEQIDFNNMSLEQENQYLRAKLAIYEEFADYMKSGLP